MCLLNDKVQVNILLTKEFEGDCSSYEKKAPFYESVPDFACLRQGQYFGY